MKYSLEERLHRASQQLEAYALVTGSVEDLDLARESESDPDKMRALLRRMERRLDAYTA